jgi:putative ABC transport system substrate-binding protein
MLGKRLQLLKDVFPRVFRLAVLRIPNFPTDQTQWNWLERASSAFNVKLIPKSMNQPDDLEPTFEAIRREHPDGLFVLNSPLALMLCKQLADLAAGQRLPAIYPFTEVAEAGGLMSYGASRPDLYRQGATYVVKVLEGAKPADLPMVQPTKFELAVNVTTAKKLHLNIPDALLALADKVIE